MAHLMAWTWAWTGLAQAHQPLQLVQISFDGVHGHDVDLESRVREAAFGPSERWGNCWEHPGLLSIELIAPPLAGSFTEPHADETLYAYVVSRCLSDVQFPRALVVARGDQVLRVYEHTSQGYWWGLSGVAALDLDGDGISELIEERAGTNFSWLVIHAVDQEGFRALADIDTFDETCGLAFDAMGFVGSTWSAAVGYLPSPEAGSWPSFRLDFEYYACDLGPSEFETRTWAERWTAVSTLAASDPVGAALEVLALAREGDPSAQGRVAEMYRSGEILPRDLELAAWWEARAVDAAR